MRVVKHKSETVRETVDARARRTRAQIDAAFVDLLHRRAYESIRVSDIAKKARVGRATFYAHYDSKDALLRSQFSRIVEPMIRFRPADPCPFDCTALFSHILTARRIYRSLAGTHVVRECFEHCIAALIEQGSLQLTVPVPAVSRLVASSLQSFMGWWLEHEASDSAAQMQITWSAIVGGGLGGIRSGAAASASSRRP
jgi:AcrR family transcriptional regulator